MRQAKLNIVNTISRYVQLTWRGRGSERPLGGWGNVRGLILALTGGLLILVAEQVEGASSRDGGFQFYAASCGTVVSAYAPGGKGGYTLWLEGYLTAYNMLKADTVDILGDSDRKSAILWIVNYCKAHPLKSLSDAAAALMIELYPERHRNGPAR